MKICRHQRNYLARHCFRVLSECGEQLACSREQYGPGLKDAAHDLACVSAILDRIGWDLELGPDYGYVPEVFEEDDPIMPIRQLQAWARRFVGVDETLIAGQERALEIAGLEREYEEQPLEKEPEINLQLAGRRRDLSVGQSILLFHNWTADTPGAETAAATA